jgi:putative peptidoglycan binding protein/LysM domain-containing protein
MASFPHTVQPGECLSRIAQRYGFGNYLAVWNDPSNARLRSKRLNPNVLFPGDVVNIPNKKEKTMSASTQRRHKFIVKLPKKELRVVFIDATGKPLGNVDYVLVVDGDCEPGKTDGDGLLKATLPIRLGSVVVEIAGRHLKLDLGELNPIGDLVENDASGVQQRLRNLGYDVGPIDGKYGARTSSAIRFFQVEHNLEIDGKPSMATLEKLVETHGS